VELLINIDVDDLEAAVAFYRQGVGLRVGRRLFAGTVVEMLGASAPIYLLERRPGTPAGARSTQRRDYGRHWTPVHLDIVVEDVAAAVRNAVAAGATLEGEPRSFRWGRLATLSDPFGHGLCFVQWRGKGYDEAL